MKKTKIIFPLAMALLLAGCGNDSTSSAESSSNETSSSSIETSSEETSSETTSEADSSSKEESSSVNSSSEETREFSIVLEADEGVTISSLPSKAEAGNEVSFTINVLDGFELKTVEAFAGVESLALTAGFDGEYSFTMPKRGVTIKVSSSRLSYKLTVNDAQKFVSSIKQKKVGSDDYVALDKKTETTEDDEEGTTSESYDVAEFGASILASLTEVSGYQLTGVKVNGESLSIEKDATSFTFVMPAKATSVTISYDYLPLSFTVVNSEHITLSFFASDKVTPVTDSYTPYKDLYIKATPSSEQYSVKNLYYSYADSLGRTTKVEITSIDDDGFYHFVFPKYDSGITITVIEYDSSAYKDAKFVGDYLCVELSYASSKKDITSFTTSSSLSISPSGEITYHAGQSEKEGYAVSSFTYEDGNGVVSLTKSSSYSNVNIYYDDNVAVFATYFDYSLASAGYVSVALRKTEEGASYSVKGSQFSVNSKNYSLLSFYNGNTLIENVLIDRSSKNAVTFKADVEMLEGSYVSDAKSIFKVSKGGETLLSVGYKGDGGAANRVLLGSEYGDYLTSDGKTLHLDGAGNATYDSLAYSYTLGTDGVTITLTSNSKTIIGTLDLSAKTFTISSEQEATKPAWYGKTYKGTSQWDSTDSDTRTTFTITFSAEEAKMSTSTFSHKQDDIEYTITNGTTISTKFYTSAYKDGFNVTMVYNASNDSFTVNGGVTGDYFKNTKFTVVS